MGGEGTRGVSGMYTGLFDVFHDTSDNNIFPIRDCINIKFNCVFKILVYENRMFGRSFHGAFHILFQRLLVINNLHRPPTENIGRSYHNRIPDPGCCGNRFFYGESRVAVSLLEFQSVEELSEAFAVFCSINGIGRRTEDFNIFFFERDREFQGRLSSELDNDTFGFFSIDDVQHIFYREGFEVEPVSCIIISTDCFRITVYHDCFIPELL